MHIKEHFVAIKRIINIKANRKMPSRYINFKKASTNHEYILLSYNFSKSQIDI